MTTGKTIALTRQIFVGKVMSLLGHNFSSKEQASSNFITVVTICSDFGAPKIKSVTVSTVSPSICHEVTEPDAIIFVFWMWSFKPTFSLSSFTFIKRLYSSSLLSVIKVVSSAYLGYWYFFQQSWFQLVLHPVQHFSWCTLHISEISRVTIYSLDVFLSWFGTSLIFHVQF